METEQTAPRIPATLVVATLAILTAYAGLSFHANQTLTTVLVLVGALPLILYLPTIESMAPRAAPLAMRALSLLLLGFSVAVFTGHLEPLLSWTFIVPLVLFAAWSLPVAIAATLVFILLAVTLATDPVLGAIRHQLFPMLILTTALTGLAVYLREYKAAQLAPLRRTDSLTLASTHEYLQSDLNKEIQRSEREGTPLSVAAFHLDEPEPRLASADRTALIVRIGRMLHRELRDFDSYYRIDEMTFFLILPVTPTAEAIQTAERLRQRARELTSRQHVPLTVSAGIAGMNVGDDPDSLDEKAREALRRARKQGGNRILSFTDDGGWQPRNGSDKDD